MDQAVAIPLQQREAVASKLATDLKVRLNLHGRTQVL